MCDFGLVIQGLKLPWYLHVCMYVCSLASFLLLRAPLYSFLPSGTHFNCSRCVFRFAMNARLMILEGVVVGSFGGKKNGGDIER